MKKYKVYSILLFYFCLTGLQIAFSQKVSITARLDSNKIMIGDQVKLKLNAVFPEKTLLFWPAIPDSVSKNIEVVAKSKIDTNKTVKKGWCDLSQTLTITSFDSGSFYFPQISFLYKEKGDTATQAVLSDSVLLNVNTVKVDTTKAFRDIKPPMSVPITWQEVLPYIIGALLLAGIIWFLIYFFRKKKKGESLFVSKKPVVPCHIEALTSLENLKEKKLWQNNKVKEYYTILTEIVRLYIEKRFAIKALEMTSDEIAESFRTIDIYTESKDDLRKILVLADLVKFAKAHPLPNEHDKAFEDCKNFILTTAEKQIENTDESQVIQNNGPIQ
jgi:hypothetical protein